MPILFGADKVLAQDSTNVAQPDTQKKKIESYQSISQTPQSQSISIDTIYPGNGFKYNAAKIEIAEGDTNITIIPNLKKGFYTDSSTQVQEMKKDLGKFLSQQVEWVKKKSEAKISSAQPDSGKVGRNYLETNNAFVHNADRITLASDLFTLPLTLETNMGLDELIHANTGGMRYNVVNAKKGTKNIIRYLQSAEAKKHFSDEEIRIKKTNYYAKLDSINKANILSDSVYDESAEKLTRALEDKVLSPSDSLFKEDGSPKVEKGIYMLLPKNQDKSESNPIYVIVENKSEFNIIRVR